MSETLPKLVLTPGTPAFITLLFDTPLEGDKSRTDGSTYHYWMFKVMDENESRFTYFAPSASIAAVMSLATKGTQFTLVESATIVDGKAKKVTNIYEGWVDIGTATPIPLALEKKMPPPQTSSTAPPVSGTAPPQRVPQTSPTVPPQSRTAPPSIPVKQSVTLGAVANTMEACIISAKSIAEGWPEEQQQAVAVSMFICSTRENHIFLTRDQVKATAKFYAKDDGSVDFVPPEDADYDNAPPPEDNDNVDYSDEPQGEEGLPF